jgi:hypothetical protein|tara:strand:+ start:277 stop:522 length:246 start_codon:yes stop_codon:yes gene_type:complete
MTEETNVISIDGNDYKESDLTDKQRKYIWHIRDLQQKINKRKVELEPLEVALQSFTNMLIAEVKEQYQFENGESFENDPTN